MKRLVPPLLLAALAALSVGLAPAGRSPAQAQPAAPGAPGTAPVPAQVPATATAPAPLRRNQTIRIGLTTARDRVSISCSPGSFRATDPATGQTAWKDSYPAPLIVGIRGAAPTPGRLYRVQVGSFDRKDAAEDLATKLRGLVSEPVVLAWSPDRKVWRIRVGAADSREALAGVVAKLRAASYPDAWISDEPVPQAGAAALILLDISYDAKELGGRTVLFEPVDPGALLSVDGAAYRGSLEVRLDAAGAIRVINALPVEAYLRGVVPSELGPNVYPEIEALKAQTIAARTYVYRNLGQFADEGFDLCDTPRCQVYGGVKAEHALSDRAIQETEGEIAVYQGAPINALYTSTCGGHTEDAAAIFVEDAAPYLIGVPCAPEERSRKLRRIVLEGNPALQRAASPAEAEAAALLVVHDLLPGREADAARLSETISAREADAWIDTLGTACGLTGKSAKRPGIRATGAAARPRRAATSGMPAGGGATGAGSGEEADPSSELTSGGGGTGGGEPEGASQGRGAAQGASGAGRAEGGKAEGAASDPPSAAQFASRLVARLGWSGRIDLLIDREDAESWLMDDPVALPEEQAGAVAYFLREDAWPYGRGGTPDPARPATRGDACRLLRFAAQDCALFDLREGIVRGGEASSLRLSTKGVVAAKAVAPEAWIFADFGSGPVPVQRVGIVVGDKLSYHTGAGDRIDAIALLPGRQGLSDDRYSNTSSWTVAYTADELAKKLDDYIGSGTLQDIAVVRRGVSGRVTELKVTAANGEAVIRGFPIRTALGLKENLFVLSKQRDKNGVLRRVVFTGRGWGHGVGMCQVGAYGMALRGAGYQEILKHYYTGISLEKLP